VKLNWKDLLLWSNQFYGICAVFLAMETNVLLIQKMPHLFLLLFIHFSTVVFYTHAYLNETHDGVYNERTTYYQNNRKYLIIRQILYTCLCMWIGFFKLDLFNLFLQSSMLIKLILCFSIFISAIYYLPKFPLLKLKSFRDRGIVKSAIIAWVWSIVCFVFPIWFELGENFTNLLSTYIFWNHFIFLFIFILVLAILFDIKDLHRDKKELINTIVAKYGIDFTIHKIIVPLLSLLFIFVLVGYILHVNSGWQLIINLLILGLTYMVARKVIYYNAIHTNIIMIDGLIIIKSLSSIVLWVLMLNN
jgi:hypothetical protein